MESPDGGNHLPCCNTTGEEKELLYKPLSGTINDTEDGAPNPFRMFSRRAACHGIGLIALPPSIKDYMHIT